MPILSREFKRADLHTIVPKTPTFVTADALITTDDSLVSIGTFLEKDRDDISLPTFGSVVKWGPSILRYIYRDQHRSITAYQVQPYSNHVYLVEHIRGIFFLLK
jgi:hypothetical protein